jgi:hypothetical protein
LATLAAFFSSTAAGGVLVMNVNERSWKYGDDHGNNHTGIVLGSRVECLTEIHNVDAVLPSAGPIGGEGLALPASTCKLDHAPLLFWPSIIPEISLLLLRQ